MISYDYTCIFIVIIIIIIININIIAVCVSYMKSFLNTDWDTPSMKRGNWGVASLQSVFGVCAQNWGGGPHQIDS
jgi:hypothetical protein